MRLQGLDSKSHHCQGEMRKPFQSTAKLYSNRNEHRGAFQTALAEASTLANPQQPHFKSLESNTPFRTQFHPLTDPPTAHTTHTRHTQTHTHDTNVQTTRSNTHTHTIIDMAHSLTQGAMDLIAFRPLVKSRPPASGSPSIESITESALPPAAASSCWLPEP